VIISQSEADGGYKKNIRRGLIYRVQYRAQNVNGWSNYSPIAYIQAARVPDAPLPVTVVTSDSTSITLKLGLCLDNGGSNLLKYTLYRDEGVLGSPFTAIYEGLFDQEYKISGLSPGLNYRLKTTATNAIGESDASDLISWYSASLPTKPVQLTRGTFSTRT
jgi:hypothetical protein